MRILRIIALALILAAAAVPQPRVDSRRGERLFETQGCIQCHSVEGRGGKSAPDLGKRIDRNYTPALLASVMWNHAPAMWTAIQQRAVATGTLTDQDAADLFAFFYAARYFDRAGDAARGKRLFLAKRCADCHGLSAAVAEGGPPVTQWRSLGDPILLAEAMWNHSIAMRQRLAQRHILWPMLSGQDLSDLLVYLRNSPAGRQIPPSLQTGPDGNGPALFTSKGCAGCHTGKLDLGPRLRGKTFTEIAADMWNHSPKMRGSAPELASGEMRQIVTYLWSRQLFELDGNATAGKAVFASKNCAICHADRSSGAPDLSARRGNFSSASMVSALWRHGPRMLDQMKSRKLAWPYLTARQMSDLIAYLNAGS